jgi:hypothetical protein
MIMTSASHNHAGPSDHFGPYRQAHILSCNHCYETYYIPYMNGQSDQFLAHLLEDPGVDQRLFTTGMGVRFAPEAGDGLPLKASTPKMGAGFSASIQT